MYVAAGAYKIWAFSACFLAEIDEDDRIKNFIRCTVILGVTAALGPPRQEYRKSWWLGIVQNQGPSEMFGLLNLWTSRDG